MVQPIYSFQVVYHPWCSFTPFCFIFCCYLFVITVCDWQRVRHKHQSSIGVCKVAGDVIQYTCSLKRRFLIAFICLLKCNSSLRFWSNMSWRHNELWLIKLNGFSGTSLTGNDLTHHPLASSLLVLWCMQTTLLHIGVYTYAHINTYSTYTHIRHLCGGIDSE